MGSSVGFVAPGEAIVEASIAQEATMKLCSVLFGDSRLKVMKRLNPPGSGVRDTLCFLQIGAY